MTTSFRILAESIAPVCARTNLHERRKIKPALKILCIAFRVNISRHFISNATGDSTGMARNLFRRTVRTSNITRIKGFVSPSCAIELNRGVSGLQDGTKKLALKSLNKLQSWEDLQYYRRKRKTDFTSNCAIKA